MKKRNPIARVVRSAAFRTRIVKSKKGRGAYTRKGTKHADHPDWPQRTPPPFRGDQCRGEGDRRQIWREARGRRWPGRRNDRSNSRLRRDPARAGRYDRG
ncbi:MAG: hypothetical protein DI537_14055 [Stutzerimonas stutzeri]|nr:MAG: hypothetical protein DI537_14055 [Stutzerimonas stutzeri]